MKVLRGLEESLDIQLCYLELPISRFVILEQLVKLASVHIEKIVAQYPPLRQQRTESDMYPIDNIPVHVDDQHL
jgi:hypothetical protein